MQVGLEGYAGPDDCYCRLSKGLGPGLSDPFFPLAHSGARCRSRRRPVRLPNRLRPRRYAADSSAKPIVQRLVRTIDDAPRQCRPFRITPPTSHWSCCCRKPDGRPQRCRPDVGRPTARPHPSSTIEAGRLCLQQALRLLFRLMRLAQMQQQDRTVGEPQQSGQRLTAVNEQACDDRTAAGHADEITSGPGVVLKGVDGAATLRARARCSVRFACNSATALFTLNRLMVCLPHPGLDSIRS